MKFFPISVVEVSPAIEVRWEVNQLSTIWVFTKYINASDVDMNVASNIVHVKSSPHNEPIVFLTFTTAQLIAAIVKALRNPVHNELFKFYCEVASWFIERTKNFLAESRNSNPRRS